MRVGKRLPDGTVYVMRSAISGGRANLTEREQGLYNSALAIAKPEDRYDFAQLDYSKGKVRFMEMNDLWDPHPHVVSSFIVDIDTGVSIDGKPTGQIYHRLETMIDPVHPSYGFHEAVTRFEEDEGLIGGDIPRNIGYRSHWEAWIEQHMSLYDYANIIRKLKED
jgi:hypothetical protein